jgi:hypothetical protein
MRLHQLYILRSQVDLLIAMEEGAAPDGPPACEHPEDKRRAVHNMGEPAAFLCLACGQTVPGVA